MILLCPSAHGLGHRARMIVLRDALRSHGVDAELAEDALPGAPALDMGARLWNGHEAGSLPEAVREVRARWSEDVAAWTSVLSELRPTRVLVDVDPAPLVAGRALGIPAALVSNFTWADLADAWGDHEGARWIASRYDGARAFAIPFTLALAGAGAITRIPHLARVPRRAGSDRPRVVLAMGRGNPAALGSVRSHERVELVLPADAPPPRTEGPIDVRPTRRSIAEEIGGADLAITKGGYSTVAECVAARTPIILVPRDGPEDSLMARVLGDAGVARVVAAGGIIDIPPAAERGGMRAAYARADPSWTTCDPMAAARAILED